MFEGIETAARRIWAVKPNRSRSGNSEEIRYTNLHKCIAFCQATKSRYERISPTLFLPYCLLPIAYCLSSVAYSLSFVSPRAKMLAT